jgi:hypothetical protein
VLPQMSTKHIGKRGEICNWRDGRVFVKGWADFCTMSNITENDRCLCEIVLREDRTIEMLMVHIVNLEQERTKGETTLIVILNYVFCILYVLLIMVDQGLSLSS